MRIAIIGTAGRKIPVTKAVWDYASEQVKEIVGKEVEPVTLISGGSAGMDHLAVMLFHCGVCAKINQSISKGIEKLVLALPCQFDYEKNQFSDTGKIDFVTNPGGTLNFYHRKFSNLIGRDTLNDIGWVLREENCEANIGKGLFERNSFVAENCDKVIALTFGQGYEPEDGGTKDTFSKALRLGKQCIHISLPI